jgi:methyl-accepting chemotaxis protein
MKIGAKLVITIIIFNIIGLGLLTGITLFQSERAISRLTDEQAEALAFQNAEKIKHWFERYIAEARTLAQIMEGYKEIPPEQRRERFNFMMRRVIIANPELASVYTNWAPNALDGMDAEYRNTPGTDGTGRFIPVWSWNINETRVTPIVGFDWEAVTQTPEFGVEYILDPSVYPGIEESLLIANMGIPVKDTGTLVGIAGITLELSTIQTMVSEIKPFGDGHALVFSSGGIIAAHTDPERLGKDMRETESDTFGSSLDIITDAVTKGTAVSFSYRPSQSNTIIQYYSVPFTIGHSRTPWTLVVGVSRNTIMEPIYRMLIICLIIGLLTVILMSVIVNFLDQAPEYGSDLPGKSEVRK